MNTDKIRQLADFVEKRTDLEFDMCFSPTCLKGFACMMEGLPSEDCFSDDICMSVLDINGATASRLFYMVGTPLALTYPDITRAHAVRVLRNLADTNHVDWVSTQ